jgi:hypothetical protein
MQRTALRAAADAERWRGRFAPRHRPADCHPLAVRRFAPAIKRMQRTVGPAS